MPKIKSVKQAVETLHYAPTLTKYEAETISGLLSQDRLSHKEAIVEVLQDNYHVVLDEEGNETEVVTLNQAIAIVNSIYKDSE